MENDMIKASQLLKFIRKNIDKNGIYQTTSLILDYKSFLTRYCIDYITDIKLDYNKELDGVRISYKINDGFFDKYVEESSFTITKQGEIVNMHSSYIPQHIQDRIVKSVPFDKLYEYVLTNFSKSDYKFISTYNYKGVVKHLPLSMNERNIKVGNNNNSINYYVRMNSTVGVKEVFDENNVENLVNQIYSSDKKILKHTMVDYNMLPQYVQEHWDEYVGKHNKVKIKSLFTA